MKVGQVSRCVPAFSDLSVFKVVNFRGSYGDSEPSSITMRSVSQTVKTVIHSLHFSFTVELITSVIKNLIERPVIVSHYMTDQKCEM